MPSGLFGRFRRKQEVTEQHWWPGLVVEGRYEVRRRLGAGGMGVVDLVRHLGWNQLLAVKSPAPGPWAGPGGLAALLQEAKVWVGLPTHPNICTCYYVRVLDGAPRIFVEYVEGGNLAEALRTGRFRTLPEILDVAIQMTWGLYAAHTAGVVHQDVKPANVLLGPDDTVKITDFGLARAQAIASAGPVKTPSGPEDSILVTRLGMTPAYASPEQMNGRHVGRRSDVWSWAVSVLQMFVGEVTWPAGSVADRALAAYVPPHGRAAMPAAVAALLGECLSEHDSRPSELDLLANRLIDIYQREVGRPYPRAAVGRLVQRADELNNKALSQLDLDEHDLAEHYWIQALQADPRHLEATFNYGLTRWRAGKRTDHELVSDLRSIGDTHGRADGRPEYLLGLVHLERGDFTAAAEILGRASQSAPDDPEIAAALATATAATASSGESRQLVGHTDRITTVMLCPDGRHAVSSGYDAEVRRWHVDTGECVASTATEGPTDLRQLDVSTDGRYALTADGRNVLSEVKGTLRWWNLATGECLRKLIGHTDLVDRATLSADNRYALSGSYKTARWWDLRKGKCVHVLTGHTTLVTGCAIAPDSRRAVTGDSHGGVRWWDLSTGVCLNAFAVPAHIGAMRISTDGRRALYTSVEGDAARWVDLRTGEHLLDFAMQPHGIESIALTPDERYAVTGNQTGTVSWWDARTGRCLCTLSGHHGGVSAVAVSSDGRHALSGGHDGTLRWWTRVPGANALTSHTRPRRAVELLASQKSFTSRINRAEALLNRGDGAAAAAELRMAQAIPGYSRDPRLLQLGRKAGRVGQRTAFVNARVVRSFPTRQDSIGGCVLLSADGANAMTTGRREMAWWSLDTGDLLQLFTGHTKNIQSAAITADNRHALTASEDSTLRWWDVSTGECLAVLHGHTDGVSQVAMTPDGLVALSAGFDGTVRRWDLTTGTCTATFTRRSELDTSAATPPSGCNAIFIGKDKVLRCWDVVTGECGAPVLTDHTDGVFSVAMNPDGRVAVSGGRNGTIQRWDLASGECTRALTGHNQAIWSLAITADGRHALSADIDGGAMRLWDLDTGQCCYAAPTRIHLSGTVAMTPDGGRAVYAALNSDLAVYEFDWNYEQLD